MHTAMQLYSHLGMTNKMYKSQTGPDSTHRYTIAHHRYPVREQKVTTSEEIISD